MARKSTALARSESVPRSVKFRPALILAWSAEGVPEPASLKPGTAEHIIDLHRGYMYFRARQYKKALNAFSNAVALKADYAEAYVGLGVTYLNQGEILQAVSAFRKATEINPHDAAAHLGLGAALRGTGSQQYPDAIAAGRKAIEIKPSFAEAHSFVASVLRTTRQFDDAIVAVHEALLLKPDNADYYIQLGDILLETERPQIAATAYSLATKIRPDDGLAYCALGKALSEGGQLSQAIMAYRKALDIDPKYFAAQYGLSVSEAALGQSTGASVHVLTDTYINSGYGLPDSSIFSATDIETERNHIFSAISELSRYNEELKKTTPTPTQARGAPAFRYELRPLPKGLEWPQDDYDTAPEFGKTGGLARYLERVWAPLSAYIDMPTLRERWPETAEAIDRQRRKLPPELPLPPTEKELIDQQAAATPQRGDRPWRLERTLQMRAYRARRKLRSANL